MGVPLFHRTTRGVALTEDGRAFYSRCREIFAQLEQAQEDLIGTRQVAQGRLRVMLHPGPGRALIVPAIPDFLRKHPGLRLDVNLDYDASDFVARGMDVCVLLGEPSATWGGHGPRGNLISVRLSGSRMLTCAAPAYIGNRGKVRDPLDLLKHDCLAMVAADGTVSNRWRFERGPQRRDVEVQPLLAVNDGPALVNAGLAGQGILHLPAINLAPRVARGELVQLLSGWHSPASPITAVFSESSRKLVRLRVFVQFLEGLFQDQGVRRAFAVPIEGWPIKRAIKRARPVSEIP
ncbi:MAG: hypothetical protein RLZZ126_1394 [Pseudomonadota bacterium]